MKFKMNKSFNPLSESHKCFEKFLDANKLKLTGVDFVSKSGLYQFSESAELGEFTKEDFRTAYGAFIDGYFRHANKFEGAFGQLKKEKDYIPCTDLGTLVQRESSIRNMLDTSDPSLQGLKDQSMKTAGVTREQMQEALKISQMDLYIQEYQLGRNANTLNE